MLIVAPEQAKDRKVTVLWGSAASIWRAAIAEGALADRWQRRSTHRAGETRKPLWSMTCGTSGAPSPDP